MKLNKTLLTALASGIAAGAVQSETITADAEDASARSNGGQGQNANNLLLAGSYYADGPGITPVFPFLLPDLGPGSPFTSATLTLELQSIIRGPATFNGDITGLDRIADLPNIIGDDWGSDGTLLQDDFYTPDSVPGVSTTGDFAAWLNEQYADGANIGRYVFIRLDTESGGDSVVTGNTSYAIATANHAELQKPTIDFSTATSEAVLAITDLNHSAENNSVTLTWRKTEAGSYIATTSQDMVNWIIELEDGLTEEDDENPADPDHITFTFSLDDVPNPSKAFFRIEEE